MSHFASRRERRLWAWTIAVVTAIYATLGFAGVLAPIVGGHWLLGAAFFVLFVLTLVAISWSGLRRETGKRETWVALGLTAAYGMLIVRLGVGPVERTHLFEYGLVGVLIHQALLERRRRGRRVPCPAVLACVATIVLGWIDEALQAVLPNRVYDLRDVGFNALAAAMAISVSAILARARPGVRREPSP